jgi:hypothetical protein
MSSLSIRSFTLFREEQPVRDALVLFTLTLLLHFWRHAASGAGTVLLLAAECRDGRDFRAMSGLIAAIFMPSVLRQCWSMTD